MPQMRGGVCNGDGGSRESRSKPGGRWDKFGNYARNQEVVKEKCHTLYVGVGHHHKISQGNGMCLSHAGNVCILWKLEGDISVSEREIPSGFEWWDTTRAQKDLLHSERRRAREYGMRLKKNQLCVFLHLECLKFATHTAARRKAACR